jgi:hypothetical protein
VMGLAASALKSDRSSWDIAYPARFLPGALGCSTAVCHSNLVTGYFLSCVTADLLDILLWRSTSVVARFRVGHLTAAVPPIADGVQRCRATLCGETLLHLVKDLAFHDQRTNVSRPPFGGV